MGRKINKAPTPTHARTLGMFALAEKREMPPSVTSVPAPRVRRLITLQTGFAVTIVRNAIVRIIPREEDTDEAIESFKTSLYGLGAAKVFTTAKPRGKVLPEKVMGKDPTARARSLRQVVHALVDESAFDDKENLREFVEEILSSERL